MTSLVVFIIYVSINHIKHSASKIGFVGAIIKMFY